MPVLIGAYMVQPHIFTLPIYTIWPLDYKDTINGDAALFCISLNETIFFITHILMRSM